MGGTYNEPNTNLTSAETTIRNAIYGVGYQRDVLGGSPATAWQLDAFGHDPQFPGIMADAGLTSSSWARGPFHEWGPNWRRGSTTLMPVWADLTEPTAMQFPSEFEWISPSGKSVLTCFMANHYSAGWWMDAAPTLEQAEREVFTLFLELAAVSATRNVLLPVGTDYSPPNRWLTAIHRDWRSRYVWPKFVSAIPREFFDAVRAERKAAGRSFSPQTRDMNPIYTGKDVSFIDTKQAQRAAENTLLAAEKLATLASLAGARYPTEAIDKAWRQLLFGAHHDGITGSESDQVYLDLLGGWREAMELSSAVVEGAIGHLGRRIDASAPGRTLAVFNTLSWPRTDVARVELTLSEGEAEGLELRDGDDARVPFVVEGVDRHADGSLARIVLAFVARDVPALGYRTYRAVSASALPADSTWTVIAGAAIENEHYQVEVDAARGGAIVSLVERRSGKQVLRPGGLGNELLAYREYPNHPLFGEGPWHLTPDGTFRSSADFAGAGRRRVVADRSALARDRAVRGRPTHAGAGPVAGHRPARAFDPHRRVRGARRALPGPVRRDGRGRDRGVRGRERGRRARLRLPERRRRAHALHARPPGVRLVRAEHDRARRPGRGGSHPRAPEGRQGHQRRRGDRDRRSGAGRGPSGPHGRARPVRRDRDAQPRRREPLRHASRWTPTFPTSASRSGARPRTPSRRACSPPWIPPMATSSTASLASAARRACGCPPSDRWLTRGAAMRTSARRGPCRRSSSPAATGRPAWARSRTW